MAMMLAMRYQPGGHAHFLFVTTIEPKECKEFLAPGVPVVFDDVDPSDSSQLVHTSIGMWKAILQGSNPFSPRARNEDIQWAKRMPKIITSNATTVDAWLGKLGIAHDRSHVEAIEMRLADCEVPGTLWARPLAPLCDSLLDECVSHNDVLSAFGSMF